MSESVKGLQTEVTTEAESAKRPWVTPQLSAPGIDITAVKGAATSEDPTNLSASFS